MSDHFERTRRIIKTDEFSSVFRLRPLFKTDHLTLYAKPNNLSHARLGVVVAKRLAPRAVTRNAVKRAVREGFRRAELMKSLGLDCVVRLSKPMNKPISKAINKPVAKTLARKESKKNKSQPACTAEMQTLLFCEVAMLFSAAARSRFKRALEVVRDDQNVKGIT